MDQHRSESTQQAKREEQARMFGNRLAKNVRHRRKWAARTHTSCYRLYDRDIPEVPLALEWWDGRLLISHFLELDRELEPAWLKAMVGVATQRLGLDSSVVFVKERKRQKGSDQYTRTGETGERFTVADGDCSFWVNLSDYLDTGLFLDHRETRRIVAADARGKRMLNLYAYTGSFSVHAAKAGALETTSVDLSNTYTRWTQENLELNKLSEHTNLTVASDSFDFLSRARTNGDKYDVVVVDPPIFSNSKRMSGTFDVQRDHGELLHSVATVCRKGASVYFSTSRHKFRLESDAVASVGFSITDISAQTIPDDFRHRRPHRCWKLVLDQ